MSEEVTETLSLCFLNSYNFGYSYEDIAGLLSKCHGINISLSTLILKVRKSYVKTSSIKVGDLVLVRNEKKGKLEPVYDPRSYTVTEKKGQW